MVKPYHFYSFFAIYSAKYKKLDAKYRKMPRLQFPGILPT